MDKKYGGVVWTDHAIERLRERGIKQGDAWVAFQRPDFSKKGQKQGVFVYYKTFDNEKIEVVAIQNENKEWVILSVWSKKIIKKNIKPKKSLLRILFEKLLKK